MTNDKSRHRLEVQWSDEAMEQVDRIKAFILVQWSFREVNAFMELIRKFEELVSQYPNGYQRSERYLDCRRAVVHPNVSIVYEVNRDTIDIVTVYDNRAASPEEGNL
ncbi:MAG: type II toxin-antitoxin system RelE/ParE family toxin [Flavobacteriales bacterium]